LNNGSEKSYDFEGSKVILTKGDYSPLMGMVADNLFAAKVKSSISIISYIPVCALA